MYIDTYERRGVISSSRKFNVDNLRLSAYNLDVYFSRKCKIKIIQRSVTAANLGSSTAGGSLAADDVLSYSHVVFMIEYINLLANAV